MLASLALIFLTGLALGWIFSKLRIPSFLGMLIAGIALGPHALNLLDGSLLAISAELRQIALIIILARAGLALDTGVLKKVGRPALLMCFLPACFEIAGMVILAPRLLGISVLEAAIMGAVVGAVSPAVIVPKMLRLTETGHGTAKGIPQLIMAGASVDDVFVIVLFTAFVGLAQGRDFSPAGFLQIPVSILTGLAGGIAVGLLLAFAANRINVRPPVKILVLLCVSFLFVTLEKNPYVPFSGLLAVMAAGASMLKKSPDTAKDLSSGLSKLWVGAEVLLFALVGATVDLSYAAAAGLPAVLIIFGALVFRVIGVFCCLVKTRLTWKERLFCAVAYIPKATVQAAIGSIPLTLGLACGDIVLTVAVLAILITAPLGAFGVDMTYGRLLSREGAPPESPGK